MYYSCRADRAPLARSACQEILTRAGWTPAHAAAGFGGSKHQQILEQLLDDHDEGALAKDTGAPAGGGVGFALCALRAT